MEREKILPLEITALAQQRRVITEIRPACVNLAETNCYFQVVSYTNPTYTAGGESCTLQGVYRFAELVTSYQLVDYGEEERVKVRLDGWDDSKTELLMDKAASLGKRNQEKVIFDRRLSLGELADLLVAVEGGETESAQQLRLYEQDRQSLHFGPDAQHPQYLLSGNGEIVVFDDKLGKFIKLKHTTNDEALITAINQIEAYCRQNPDLPVKAVLVGSLSARTRSLESNRENYLVVTYFTKDETGRIDFESHLPPNKVGLQAELAKHKVAEPIIAKVLAGELTDGVVHLDSLMTNNKSMVTQRGDKTKRAMPLTGNYQAPAYFPNVRYEAGIRSKYGVAASNGEEAEFWQTFFAQIVKVIKLAPPKISQLKTILRERGSPLAQMMAHFYRSLGQFKPKIPSWRPLVNHLTDQLSNLPLREKPSILKRSPQPL